MVQPHHDWDIEPQVSTHFQRVSKDGRSFDRFSAYIIGTAKNGKRYCRAVDVLGREMGPRAEQKLMHTLAAVTHGGPSLCTELKDGGELPLEKDQPPIV